MGWWYYSRPKMQDVKGGIKAQSKRGDFGQSWWAKRWTQVIHEYDIGERINRGKTYARKGQVERITIRKGEISAVVHGSWAYEVRIEIDMIGDSQWSDVADAIFSRPATAAKLLAGIMPDDMEDIFSGLGLGFFPGPDEIRTDCTCPDWANPCKHIAAVYLLLGEEFDRDPFLIFRLRGIERSELLKIAGIDVARGKKGSAASSKGRRWGAGEGGRDGDSGAAKNAKASSPDPDAFWGRMRNDQEHDYDLGNAAIPAVPAALVRQLGSFPFWRSAENFMESMEGMYQNASREGVRVFLGESAGMYDDDAAADANDDNSNIKSHARARNSGMR